MRFLKNKIKRALELAELRSIKEKSSQFSQLPSLPQRETLLQEKLPINPPNKRWMSTRNNIMKNYCRAFINFALSPMAASYIINEAENGISHERFMQILNSKRKNVNCIKGLRNLLLKERRDSAETIEFKKMFQKSCEVFLKFFCVNWIFNSKVEDRIKHLNYRFKILRRIQNPQYFTYLEEVGRRHSRR